jgi:uncharacterized glyoxalase superfamily protein PhnB
MRRELFPIIACRDLSGTTRWYRSVFEAEPSYQFPEEGDPVYLTLRVGDSTIALADGTGPNAYGSAAFPSTGHPVDLCVYVDDLDATLATGAGDGGDLVIPAADMPWGERVGWLRDPEGVMLLVIQGDPADG